MRLFFLHIFVVCSISLALQKPTLADQLVELLSFTDFEQGTVEDWLKAKGFVLQQDATRRDRINLDVSDDGLRIEAKRKAFGLMVNESANVQTFRYVEIDWGVSRFPEGVSYEQGVRNEPIMVYFFLGDERYESGSLFIPDSPYFIGLFLCHGDDRIGHPYSGSYFKKGGRYVCGDQPKMGELYTTRFDLLQAYRTHFDKELDDDPAISGIAVAVDTSKAKGDGKSVALIREIRVYR
jgi:hypothetical protein